MFNLFSVSSVIILLLFVRIPPTASQKTHRLFWDDKNPIFIKGNNRMFVEDGDEIVLICPENSVEYYNIYWSKKKDVFENCELNLDPTPINLVTCEPNKHKEFKFQVTKFSWVSLNPSFLPGKPIYLLTDYHFCSSYNMKIAIILKENVDVIKEAAPPERVVQPKNSASSYLTSCLAISTSIAILLTV